MDIDLSKEPFSINLLGRLLSYDRVSLINLSREDISLIKSAVEFYANLSDTLERLEKRLDEENSDRKKMIKNLEKSIEYKMYEGLRAGIGLGAVPQPQQQSPYQQPYTAQLGQSSSIGSWTTSTTPPPTWTTNTTTAAETKINFDELKKRFMGKF